MIDMDESRKEESFLHTKTRTELESDLEQCLERKQNLEEEKNALHNLKIDLETMLNQREEELSQVRSHIESFQSGKEELETEVANLRELRASDQRVLEELRHKISAIEQGIRELQEENSRLKTELELCETDKETYKTYSEKTEKLIEVKTGKLQADMRDLQQITQQYRTEIEEKDKKIVEYEKMIEKITEEKEALESQMLEQKRQTESKEFMVRLGGKLDELQSLVKEFEAQSPVAAPGEEGKDVEMETLLAEPEHIGLKPEIVLEPEREEIPEVQIEDVEPGEEGEEPELYKAEAPEEGEEFKLFEEEPVEIMGAQPEIPEPPAEPEPVEPVESHEKPSAGEESARERWGEDLWEEPEGESEKEVVEPGEEEEFPWEKEKEGEDEDFSW